MSDTKYRDQKREEIREAIAYAKQELIAAQEQIEVHEEGLRRFELATEHAATLSDDELTEQAKHAYLDFESAVAVERPQLARAALKGTWCGYEAALADRGLGDVPQWEAEDEQESTILHTTMTAVVRTFPDDKLLSMYTAYLNGSPSSVGFVGGLQATTEQIRDVLIAEMDRRNLLRVATPNFNA